MAREKRMPPCWPFAISHQPCTIFSIFSLGALAILMRVREAAVS